MRRITITEHPDGLHVEIEGIKDKIEGVGILGCAQYQLMTGDVEIRETKPPMRPMRRMPAALDEIGATLGPRSEATISQDGERSE